MKKSLGDKYDSDKSKESAIKSDSEYVLNLKSLLPPNFYDALRKDENILSGQNRRKLVEILGDDIRDTVSVVTSKLLTRIAIQLVKMYPTSLGCIRKDSNERKECSSSFSHSLKYRIDYLNSLNKTKKCTTGSSSQAKKHTRAQNYGLNPELDLPNDLPENETSSSQVSKRELMVKMAGSGDPINWNCVKRMMEETYVSQRETINSMVSIENILAQWPFIGKHSVLQSHFERLMDTSVPDLMENVENLFPQLERFFNSESAVKRRGSAASISDNLHSILMAWEGGEKSGQTHLIAIVLCCMTYMGVGKDKIFVPFEETTSFDEVQASDLLPDHGKPIIAVLGSNIQLNPKAYVVVEKRIISENQISVSKSIFVLLMSYFVFKIEYDQESAPILDFLQRQVFKIEADGTRVGRRRTDKGYSHAPVHGPSRKYLNLMKKFREYCTKWNIDL